MKYRLMAAPRALVLRLIREECELAAIPGVTPQRAMSRDRRAACAWIRARVTRRLYAMDKFSLPGIAKPFGMDHTTVLHALRRTLSETPPPLRPYSKAQRRRNGELASKKAVLESETPVFWVRPQKLFTALPPSEITVPLARLMGMR